LTKRRETAPIVVIDTQGRFLLQRREDLAGILYPGWVSLFGGHREGDESFLECAVREFGEELSYHILPDRFERLGSREYFDDGSSDAVLAEFFLVREVPVEQLAITEGSLLIVAPGELEGMRTRLTPSSRYGLDLFATKLSGC
jgi:8-oxo-dGTP pyrophosphatase MutT (NUDIX family)